MAPQGQRGREGSRSWRAGRSGRWWGQCRAAQERCAGRAEGFGATVNALVSTPGHGVEQVGAQFLQVPLLRCVPAAESSVDDSAFYCQHYTTV